MNQPKKIVDAHGRPYRDDRAAQEQADLGRLRSRYDAAQTTDDNSRHWANADALSAAAANDPATRARLRQRSRYERANNGYYGGLIDTMATDTIGTGPCLQGQEENATWNREVEDLWWEWCELTLFVDGLLLADKARVTDGETVLLRDRDPQRDGVQLDFTVVEAEQLSGLGTFNPRQSSGPSDLMLDGVQVDRRGRPYQYRILKQHPGDGFASLLPGDAIEYPASHVVHWFRKERPGQYRGVPELLASLPLCAMLRRWTLAAILAAEIAASFAAVMETDSNSDEEDVPTPFQKLEIARGLMMALPAGSKMNQFDPKQPHNLYQETKRELLKEIGRPVSAPFNVVSGDSSPYNYSSARLDHLLYRAAITVKREHCRRHVLERVFGWWWEEATARGVFSFKPSPKFRHTWRWPGFSTIDPLKEAQADTERLSNLTTTLADLLADENKDWEEQLDQRDRELKRLKKSGDPLPKWATGGAAATPPPEGPQKPADEEADEDEEDPAAILGGRRLNGHMNGKVRQ